MMAARALSALVDSPAGWRYTRLASLQIERALNEALALSGEFAGNADGMRAGARARFYAGNERLCSGYIQSVGGKAGQEAMARTFTAQGELLDWQSATIWPSWSVRNMPLDKLMRELASRVGGGWRYILAGSAATGEARYTGIIEAGRSAYEALAQVGEHFGYDFYAGKGAERELRFGDFGGLAPALLREAPFSGRPAGPGEAWIETVDAQEQADDLVNRLLPYIGEPDFGLTLAGDSPWLEDSASAMRYGARARAMTPEYLLAEPGQGAEEALRRWGERELAKRAWPQRVYTARGLGGTGARFSPGRPARLLFTAQGGERIDALATISRTREEYGPEGERAEYELATGKAPLTMARAIVERRLAGRRPSALTLTTLTATLTERYAPAREAERAAATHNQLAAPVLRQGRVFPGTARIEASVEAVSHATKYRWACWSHDAEPNELETTAPEVEITTANTNLRLLTGTSYSVKARAEADGWLASEWSETVQATPIAAPGGDGPQQLAMEAWPDGAAQGEDRQVRLNLPPVNGARFYAVEAAAKMRGGDELVWEEQTREATGGEHVATGLNNGQPYLFRAKALGYEGYCLDSDWSPALEGMPVPNEATLEVPPGALAFPQARVTVTRDSLRAQGVELYWNNVRLDMPLAFANGHREAERYDIRKALAGRLAAGEQRLSLRLPAGRNGEAFYEDGTPDEEQLEFSVTAEVEVLAVLRESAETPLLERELRAPWDHRPAPEPPLPDDGRLPFQLGNETLRQWKGGA